MKNFSFIFDKNIKAQTLKKIFLKKYKNYPISKTEVIVIGGGDGFMLKNIKKFIKFNKYFYGINCGTYGFLMNKYILTNLHKKINNSKKVIISPLEVELLDNKNKKKKLIAINEISLFRQTKQTANLSLEINNKLKLKKLVGDGILISTPAGSTAYNLSVNGPILSLDSGKLAITPISPFRPRRWKGIIASDKSSIKIFNLNSKKRPISAVADNLEVRNIKKVTVRKQKKIKINLLYNTKNTLTKRIMFEQKIKKNK